jgi:hypothetical protein
LESALGGYTAKAAEGEGSLFGADPGRRQAFTIGDISRAAFRTVADTQ